MSMYQRVALLFVASLTSLANLIVVGAEPMLSPGDEVSAKLFLDESANLRYTVAFKETTVVEPSALGISVGGMRLGQGVTVGRAKRSTMSENYATRGNHNRARNHFNAYVFSVKHNKSGREYFLEFRLYDDGAAYRYVVPGRNVQHVDGESSSWTLLAGAKVWYFERLKGDWKLKSYAGEWLSTDISQLHTASPEHIGPVQGAPLVFELPGALGYAAVTKAACYNYSGMRLRAVGDRTVVADFTEGAAGFDVEGTITTPWRALLLADDLDELVNSDFVKNLNPAPNPELFADTSYIKPGRSVWRFEPLDTGTPAEELQFVHYAARMGFEYSLIDSGWNELEHPHRREKSEYETWKAWESPYEDLERICGEARNEGVGVWVWCHSKFLMDPADNYRCMADYFERVKHTGAVGVKIDFMNGESKATIDFEIAALRLAAERQLMINFHGCHASTGEERTYPNEMTREGIRGIEVNKHKGSTIPASHNAALPFTRFLVGHADYTPLAYTKPGPTTWAHQLATLITFTSALQVYADDPDFILNHPIAKQALDLMLAVPVTWDETRVLPGSEIGKLAVFARRAGETWFVGVLNGDLEEKTYALDLSFLFRGSYNAMLVYDDLKAEPVDLVGLNDRAALGPFTTAVPFRIAHDSVKNPSRLSVKLAPGGGFAAMFTKEKETTP